MDFAEIAFLKLQVNYLEEMESVRGSLWLTEGRQGEPLLGLLSPCVNEILLSETKATVSEDRELGRGRMPAICPQTSENVKGTSVVRRWESNAVCKDDVIGWAGDTNVSFKT